MDTPLANVVPNDVNIPNIATMANAISAALASDPNSFSGNANSSNPSALYALIGLSVAATILVVVVLILAIVFVRKNQLYLLLEDKA